MHWVQVIAHPVHEHKHDRMPPPLPAPDDDATEGARERKRRETRHRIAETALRLFLAHGFEGTTLDVIAAESEISRRTFFSYFKSKDDILLFWQEVHWRAIYDDLLTTSPDVPPLDAVREGFTTRLLSNLCAGVAPESSEAALDEMRQAGRHQDGR